MGRVWAEGLPHGKPRTNLHDVIEVLVGHEYVARRIHVLALDEALAALESFDSRKSRIVELRFFGGLTAEETAEVLGISLRTVHRDWDLARTWLLRELRGTSGEAVRQRSKHGQHPASMRHPWQNELGGRAGSTTPVGLRPFVQWRSRVKGSMRVF
jgi:hypothetical protein